MGAEASEAYIQLGLPEAYEPRALELAEGFAATAAAHGVAIAGGDVTRSPVLFCALTVVGTAPSASDLVSRSGARPGDLLALTGELGGAAAGLLLLERPELARAVGEARAEAMRARQMEPEPRLAAGRALAACGASAMIDISDGLAGDARHLASASGVSLAVDTASVPRADGLAELAAAAGIDPLEPLLGGGEDYELLAAIAPERFEAAAATAGVRLSVIGEVGDGEGVELRREDGSLSPASGFDQLGARRAPSDPA